MAQLNQNLVGYFKPWEVRVHNRIKLIKLSYTIYIICEKSLQKIITMI